jgi:hypothetical protein
MKFYIKVNVNSSIKKKFFWSKPVHTLEMIDVAVVAGNGNAYVATNKPYIGPFQKELKYIVHDIVDFIKFHSDDEPMQLVFFDGCADAALLRKAFKMHSNFEWPTVHKDLLCSAYDFGMANIESVSTSIVFKYISSDGKIRWDNMMDILSSADSYPVPEPNPSSKDTALWMPKFERYLEEIATALILDNIPDETNDQ